MTKRTVILAGWIAIAAMGFPGRAEAVGMDDLMDIIDKLSGPGPFKGGPVLANTILCWQDGAASIRGASEPGAKDPCWYFDFRDLHVKPDGTYQHVSAKLVETGISLRPRRFLEIGAGLGVAYFSTTVDNIDYKVRNATLTPLRLIIKPLRIVPKLRDKRHTGWLQLHVRGTVRFGDINGADFGVPANTFDAGTELLWGGGLVIDLLEAVRGR